MCSISPCRTRPAQGFPTPARRSHGALADARGLVYAPEPFGLPAAREAVAAELRARGASIAAGRVLLTASTSEAYSFLFKLLADPGDAVLVPQPSYPLFEHLATFEGARVVPYPLAYDGEWHVDLPALRAAIDATTRAIVIVSPNNPTGSYLKKDELSAMAATGLPIVSDEVFADYGFGDDPRRAASVLEVASEASLVFALGGLSKLAALPQMKLGLDGDRGRRRARGRSGARAPRADRRHVPLGGDSGAARAPGAPR